MIKPNKWNTKPKEERIEKWRWWEGLSDCYFQGMTAEEYNECWRLAELEEWDQVQATLDAAAKKPITGFSPWSIVAEKAKEKLQ